MHLMSSGANHGIHHKARRTKSGVCCGSMEEARKGPDADYRLQYTDVLQTLLAALLSTLMNGYTLYFAISSKIIMNDHHQRHQPCPKIVGVLSLSSSPHSAAEHPVLFVGDRIDGEIILSPGSLPCVSIENKLVPRTACWLSCEWLEMHFNFPPSILGLSKVSAW